MFGVALCRQKGPDDAAVFVGRPLVLGYVTEGNNGAEYYMNLDFLVMMNASLPPDEVKILEVNERFCFLSKHHHLSPAPWLIKNLPIIQTRLNHLNRMVRELKRIGFKNVPVMREYAWKEPSRVSGRILVHNQGTHRTFIVKKAAL